MRRPAPVNRFEFRGVIQFDPVHHSTMANRTYITIHCPAGIPGPPFEVLGVDGRTPLAIFPTLVEAEAYAANEAKKTASEVLISPLARGRM